MSILVDADTRVIVQGITGRDGSFHTQGMLSDGTLIVGGVTPGKGGQQVSGVPVFDSVLGALRHSAANCSVIFVPAPFASAAIREAADAMVPLIICITEGIPVLEMLDTCRFVRERGLRLIGPNCPGVVSPGKCKVGIMPGSIHLPGSVAVISRSGTLTYEVVSQLSAAGIGQSTCVGIGGDPVVGTSFVELLELLDSDPHTSAVVLVGEIGGDDEERAAEFIAAHPAKRVVAFLSGRSAPPGRRMGHAGAIISGGSGGAAAKAQALKEAGAVVVERPDLIPAALQS